MKKMGRRHRPFFRICAMDTRTPRDGRAIEELGYYDPMVRDVNARAVLNRERIDYWLSVGALPTEKVAVLIKKYGSNGTHLEQQQAALEKLKASLRQPLKPAERPASEGDQATPPAEPPAAETEAAPAGEAND
jgi:small subunit ribosomal protein S16